MGGRAGGSACKTPSPEHFTESDWSVLPFGPLEIGADAGDGRSVTQWPVATCCCWPESSWFFAGEVNRWNFAWICI